MGRLARVKERVGKGLIAFANVQDERAAAVARGVCAARAKFLHTRVPGGDSLSASREEPMAIVEASPVTSTPLDIIELRHKRRESALTQLAAAALRRGVVRDLDALVAALVRRERLGTTALGKGVALTHARSIAVVRPFWVVGRSPKGVEWAAPDGEPVHLVVLYLAHHEQGAAAHLARLAAAAQALRLQRTRQRLLAADAATVFALLQGSPS